MMGGGRGGRGGGVTEVHMLYPKNPNFRICLPEKIPTFLAYRKKSLSVFASANHITSNKVKVKWCIYIVPFPCEYAQRRFTMIRLPPADRERLYKAVHVCWYSFYQPRKDGKLSEL